MAGRVRVTANVNPKLNYLGSWFLSFCGLASFRVNFYIAFFVSPKFLVAYVVGNGFGILNCSLANTHFTRNHWLFFCADTFLREWHANFFVASNLAS